MYGGFGADTFFGMRRYPDCLLSIVGAVTLLVVVIFED